MRLQVSGAALVRWMRGEGSPDPAAQQRRLRWRIFVVALAVRLLYVTLAHTYRVRPFGDHFQFGWEMGRIARALATGYGFADPFNGHSGPTAWTPPLFPLLLGGIFKLCGVYSPLSGWIILGVDSIFSAATAVLVHRLALLTFGHTREGGQIALWSGWIWALDPAAMQYAVRWIWEMSLTVFLFTAALLLALRLRALVEAVATGRARRRGAGLWVGYGVLWGLVGLSNSALLPFLPVSLLWIAVPALGRRTWLPAAGSAVLAGVCTLLVLSPWIVRNALVFHAFVPMRGNGGAELFESVRPSNRGFPYGTTVSLAVTDPEFERYRGMGEVAYSYEQGRRGQEIIRADPALFAGHALQRVFMFWAGVPHDGNRLLEFLRLLNISFTSAAGLLGLGLAIKRKVVPASLFGWAIALVPLVYYLLTVQARFRHPLEPMLCILAVYLFRSAESRRDHVQPAFPVDAGSLRP